MADGIKDFVHECFRDIDAKLDKILASNEATSVRLASIESCMTSLEGSIVQTNGSAVQVNKRMNGMQKQLDSIGRRLDRIERRLELADAPQTQEIGFGLLLAQSLGEA